MFNSITAAAYLVKDPEVRPNSTGKKVANLRAGISTANAKTKCFIDIEYWDKTAEIAEKYLTKGRDVVITIKGFDSWAKAYDWATLQSVLWKTEQLDRQESYGFKANFNPKKTFH